MSDAAYKKEGQTCCLCIPIQCGMKVMAILNIIGAIITIIQGAVAMAQSPGNGVMFLLLSLLPLLVSWKWFLWLKEDTEETTDQLVKWMRLQFFVNSVLQIVIGILVIAGVFNSCSDNISQEDCDKIFAEHRGMIIPPVILQVCVSILIMFYFYNVTRRYKDAFHS